MLLKGTGRLLSEEDWSNKLYQPLSATKGKEVSVTLVPYYAWGNRGHLEMSVWMLVR